MEIVDKVSMIFFIVQCIIAVALIIFVWILTYSDMDRD